MKGAVLNVAPIKPIRGWHKAAPDITPGGKLWEKWAEAGLRKYMQTGLTPKGGKSDAPMPTYKLSAEDADARRRLPQNPEIKVNRSIPDRPSVGLLSLFELNFAICVYLTELKPCHDKL